MDNRTAIFQAERKRLMGIAYRMLGSTADAEDVLQDAWLRWNESDTGSLRSAQAWLVTIVTRLAIDRLRAAKTEREHYSGIWLPEPVVEASPETPQQALELADDVSVAFLQVLEQLTPEERAAFVLRQVFDADYADVAQALGRSEAACRQLVHRAAERLKDKRPRFAVSREAHLRLLREFAQAAASGDLAALRGVLSADAQLISDGGGKVKSFDKVLQGAHRLAMLYFALARRLARDGQRQDIVLAEVNGKPGLLRYIDGQLESVQAIETDGLHITSIQSQRNPDKLARVAVTNR
jgi:RNA polymerase sigma-70 factor (TIGR02957 family)